MKILQVNLNCYYIEEMKQFYRDILDMELISSTDSSFSVMAGSTKLVFTKSDEIPYYHFCFRTSSEYFEYMFLILDNEERLLEDEKGEKRMYWEGKQAYFTDPDGNILEMLERPYFSGNEAPIGWFDVNEIGLPVNCIKECQKYLSTYIVNEVKRESETFAFYGDKFGYFVMVKEGRHWYPMNSGSVIDPLEVTVSGKEDAEFRLLDYPYVFKVKKEK